jgi:hypothetical protein
MMKSAKVLHYVGKIANGFEVAIAFFILIVIMIRVVEIILGLIGIETVILNMDFDRILSTAFALVIGVEFTKMLCKHTPETVIDVLLFAMARQTILYQQRATDMLIGVFAITGLFAAKRFVIDKIYKPKEDNTGDAA